MEIGKKLAAVLAPQLLYATDGKSLPKMPNLSGFGGSKSNTSTSATMDETETKSEFKPKAGGVADQIALRQQSTAKLRASKKGDVDPTLVAIETLKESSKQTDALTELVNRSNGGGSKTINNITNTSVQNTPVTSQNTSNTFNTNIEDKKEDKTADEKNQAELVAKAQSVKFGQGTKGSFNVPKFKEAQDQLSPKLKLTKSKYYPSVLRYLKVIAKSTKQFSKNYEMINRDTLIERREHAAAIKRGDVMAKTNQQILQEIRDSNREFHTGFMKNRVFKSFARWGNEIIDKQGKLREDLMYERGIPALMKKVQLGMSKMSLKGLFKGFATKEQQDLGADAGLKKFKNANWTSKDSTALTKVIPKFLGMIHSALTGSEEKIFDYNTGRMVTISKFNANRKKLEASFDINAKKRLADASRSKFNPLTYVFGESQEFFDLKKQQEEFKSVFDEEADYGRKDGEMTRDEIKQQAFINSTNLSGDRLLEFQSLHTVKDKLEFIEGIKKYGVGLQEYRNIKAIKKEEGFFSSFGDSDKVEKYLSTLNIEDRDSFNDDEMGNADGDVVRGIDSRLDTPKKVKKYIDDVISTNNENWIEDRRSYLFKQMNSYQNKAITTSDLDRLSEALTAGYKDILANTNSSDNSFQTGNSFSGLKSAVESTSSIKKDSPMTLLDCCNNIVSKITSADSTLSSIYELITPFFSTKQKAKTQTVSTALGMNMNAKTQAAKKEKAEEKYKKEMLSSTIDANNRTKKFQKESLKVQKEDAKSSSGFFKYFKRTKRMELFGKIVSGITGFIGTIGSMITGAIGSLGTGVTGLLAASGLGLMAKKAGSAILATGASALSAVKGMFTGSKVAAAAASATAMAKGTKVGGIAASALATAKNTKAGKIASKGISKAASMAAAAKAAKTAGKEAGLKAGEKIASKGMMAKLGAKGAAKLAAKGALRFIPFVGWAYAAYEAANIAYDVVANDMSVMDATKKQILGIEPESKAPNATEINKSKTTSPSNLSATSDSSKKEITPAVVATSTTLQMLNKINSQLVLMTAQDKEYYKATYKYRSDEKKPSTKNGIEEVTDEISQFIPSSVKNAYSSIKNSLSDSSDSASNYFNKASNDASVFSSQLISNGKDTLRKIVNSISKNSAQSPGFLAQLSEFMGLSPDTILNYKDANLMAKLSQGLKQIFMQGGDMSNMMLQPIMVGGNQMQQSLGGAYDSAKTSNISGLTKLESSLSNSMQF